MTVAFKSAIDDAVIAELRAITGDDDRVLDNLSSRVIRSRVPAPFPVHRWADHMPDVAVLPKTAQEVSEVVKLANRLRIPIVPRAGGTGLSDGAVPLAGTAEYKARLGLAGREAQVEPRAPQPAGSTRSPRHQLVSS